MSSDRSAGVHGGKGETFWLTGHNRNSTLGRRQWMHIAGAAARVTHLFFSSQPHSLSLSCRWKHRGPGGMPRLRRVDVSLHVCIYGSVNVINAICLVELSRSPLYTAELLYPIIRVKCVFTPLWTNVTTCPPFTRKDVRELIEKFNLIYNKNTDSLSESIWLWRAWEFNVADDITAVFAYNKQNVNMHWCGMPIQLSFLMWIGF